MKNTFSSIVLLSLLMAGCTKTTEDIEANLDIPVVESFLTPNSTALVKITATIPFVTDTTVEVITEISDLMVYLTFPESSYLLTENADSSGYYQDQTGELKIEPGIKYQFEFEYKNKIISGTTVTPFKPENFETSEEEIELPRITEGGGFGGGPNSTEIELTWDDPDNAYYLIGIEYMEDEYDPVNELFEIDNPEELANFISQPFQDDYYTIRGLQFMFFGEYRIILLRITEEYAQLFESVSQSSLEELAEPQTNIINGKGIFAAYNSDTLMINVVED